MLPSPNGNEYSEQTYVFPVTEATQVGEARRFAGAMAVAVGLDDVEIGRIGIIVNELGHNLAKYAKDGRLLIRRLDGAVVEILSIDRGPGFANTARVLTDGFSTGTTPGTGLGAVKRLANVFDVYSQPGRGTVIVACVGAEPRQEFRQGAVNVPLAGERVCGDGWRVEARDREINVFMVDGLGHGPAAHEAARLAVDTFSGNVTLPLDQLLTAVHQQLKSTRGGAIFLVRSTDPLDLAFIGAGNVRAFLQGPEHAKVLLSQNGTAGVQIRTTRVLREQWTPGAFLVLHSDGLISRTNLDSYPNIRGHHPALAAALLYRDFERGTDDATVLVIARRA